MLYFAYGSNMDFAQLQERVGDVKDGVVGILNGYELRFNKRSVKDEYGRANLVAVSDAITEGVFFELTDEQFAEMDRREGKGYKRHDVLVQIGSDAREAQTYFSTADFVADGLYPSDEYLEHILEGARQHNLSQVYIAKIKTLAIYTADP